MRKIKFGRKEERTGSWRAILAAAGLLAAAAAVSTGCQMKKYEKIELTGISETEEEKEEREALAPSEASDTVQNPPRKAESSPVGAEITKETAPEMEARDETVYVSGSNVNVRDFPGTKASVVGAMNQGESIKRTGYSQSWSRVIYQGRERGLYRVRLHEPRNS